MDALVSDPDACARLLDEYGSPVNLLDFAPLAEHVEELRAVAASSGVDLGIRVARKANKAVALVDAARTAGAGVDVASLEELVQSLDAGMPAERIIVSAAVKEHELLRVAVAAGAVLSVDNEDELSDILAVAASSARPARLALRLAITAEGAAPTRFGLPVQTWLSLLRRGEVTPSARIEGLHFHLNGYAVEDRVAALAEALPAVPILRGLGHHVGFIDIGGGLPVRYLDDEDAWRAFWRALDEDPSAVTWRGDRLGMVDPSSDRPSPEVYPFWQHRDAPTWLQELLASPLPTSAACPDKRSGVPSTDAAGVGDGGISVAQALRAQDLALHCEPGRAMLDGCGMTLARVAFRKSTSDGLGLIGLFMNRTQLRSTSRDVLLDPLWIRPAHHRPADETRDAFLVGAYCIEEELILRRRLRFPDGVSRDDIAAFPNTGGYLMHILESASHRIPLAATVVRDGDRWVRDRGDAAARPQA
ncbi:alanine racemase [uncultured Microbacterium sp.]|uniref:alanine racemase n=1 Tax=uncultured Microbacterium sp. TaxID=191216 RepID=UPI0025F85A6E|nr:alanine racemase [uncultured Microbacterium sp.]